MPPLILIRDICFGFLDRTNVTVITLTASFVLYTRSAGVAYFSVGAVFCSFSVKALKKIIRQPRPPHIPGRKLKTSFGMPSTHSTSISYFATYILLASLYLPIHPSLGPVLASRILPPLITLPWAVAIVMSRVWLGHHTWPQVFVGSSYGVAFASVWFSMWTRGWNEVGKEVEGVFNPLIDRFVVDVLA
ncbi:hypothetical protein CPB84DRAFT_1729284 [Gymnopilus junonius]|uniref:Phosphatidic acid phosphatase type 2/haloperoxidase domain-containing protein n=1 Tax=Gymnopilus junonius TaxID=109634 RepID=A0A9P5NQX4_GYMJU|nr:hypothetical protein CPB84DRAFT_1729284 [Gymnopilus junonius]